MIDETHDPDLSSWVAASNDAATDFPIQNLPFGVFARAAGPPRVGVAIGDAIVDVSRALQLGHVAGPAAQACAAPALNPLLALGRMAWADLRLQLSRMLRAGAAAERDADALLLPRHATQMLLPVQAGNYTDFYASLQHATRVGSLFRPDNPLLPNYKYVPIGYHGRASSLVPSGTKVRRPSGQLRSDPNVPPHFAPCLRLDYELELALIIGPGNHLGQPIEIHEAADHLFGVCLLNDWSARDIQAWEYQPLGPFLAKNFATSLSTWVVTMEALAPFRTALATRPAGDPAPLPYLSDDTDQASGALDIVLDVQLQTPDMRTPVHISRCNSAGLYWTPAQLLAHHTSNGCNAQPGDVLGTGTISGADPASAGCLLELTQGGRMPLQLANGETRSFLMDGDMITLSGFAERTGFRSIGLGTCAGTVLPARQPG